MLAPSVKASAGSASIVQPLVVETLVLRPDVKLLIRRPPST